MVQVELLIFFGWLHMIHRPVLTAGRLGDRYGFPVLTMTNEQFLHRCEQLWHTQPTFEIGDFLC